VIPLFPFRFFCGVAGVLFAALFVPIPTHAASPDVVEVRDGWARWLPAGLPAAGYLKMINPSDHDVALKEASSPDYKHVALHRSITTPDGESRMTEAGQLLVPAGGEAVLAPGGYHLMLMQARRSIKPGDTVTIILIFADGRRQPVRLPVKPANQSG
jgi:copper(I)-binding protein